MGGGAGQRILRPFLVNVKVKTFVNTTHYGVHSTQRLWIMSIGHRLPCVNPLSTWDEISCHTGSNQILEAVNAWEQG